jgi:hypothetical protein
VDTLSEIPSTEREVVKRFYLEGFTIAEIAARHRRPEGTVKRQLFQARNHLRQALGITERRSTMAKQTQISVEQLPACRPEITITELDTEPFVVDCPELMCKFIVPKLGAHTSTASYFAPDWKRDGIEELRVIRSAKVHEIEAGSAVI